MERTVADVFDTYNEDQKNFVYMCAGRIINGGRRPKRNTKQLADLGFNDDQRKVFWFLIDQASK